MANFVKSLIYSILQRGGVKLNPLETQQKIKEVNVVVNEYVHKGMEIIRHELREENLRFDREASAIRHALKQQLDEISTESYVQRQVVQDSLTELKEKISVEKAGAQTPEEIAAIYDKYKPMRKELLDVISSLTQAKNSQIDDAYNRYQSARMQNKRIHEDTLASINERKSQYHGERLAKYKEQLVNKALNEDGNAE